MKNNGQYSGLLDFMERTGASLIDTKLLIKAGCFRNIEPYNQPQLLYMAHIFRMGKEKTTYYTSCSFLHFERNIKPHPMKDIPFEQKIKNEIELYGFIVSMQPMCYWRKRIKDKNVIFAKELKDHIGKSVKVAGTLITAKTVPTKHNELMQFISFEDETAIFETVFFPKVYKRHALKLSHQKPYILHGKVASEFSVISLNVYDIEAV